MERERFESIIKGMQEKLDQIEPLNIELINKIHQLNLDIKQLQQKVADLIYKNQAKDSTILTLTKENNDLKSEVSNQKSNTVNQKLLLIGLVALCIFLTYKLLLQK